ncbi:MAG: hypothetical protein U5N26_04615 [Candidatus Marinimicrobia bacterium]|nr:hypothetical protein [Candidatus Neomarinimicrobiota bacterium]
MKKLLSMLIIMTAIAIAAVPGTVHLIYTNGIVTTSGDDTFFEFDIQAYIEGTSNDDDLYLGDGMIYVEYDAEIFGSHIAGTENLVVLRRGVLEDSRNYQITNSNNTASNIFGFSFVAPFSLNEKQYYTKVSSDASNPSDLLHIKIKVKASGSCQVSFPHHIPKEDLYWSLGDQPYAGGLNIIEANEEAFIEGPVSGDPYTSIELESLEAAYKGGMVRMKWKTASETENAGFIVKRAVAGSGGHTGIYEENRQLYGEREAERRRHNGI